MQPFAQMLTITKLMYVLGIDIGTSAVKVAVVNSNTKACIANAQYPDEEAKINVLNPGWAEQSPIDWWHYTQQAILKVIASGAFNSKEILAIGIAYQMHGLVVVDAAQQLLRDSIIWCDSRAVDLGQQAFQAIGEQKALHNLLNSPGNFTASKLAWVKQHETDIYQQIDKIMLPGDFIAMMLTGQITTTIPALSEGIFWDFQKDEVAQLVMDHYGFDDKFIPEIRPLFAEHGRLKGVVAAELGLAADIPVTYKAGDQPNNALSLNVLQPGEVAATAGTSGVIYGVSDQLTYDQQSRINTFAHVTYTKQQKHTGVLLCINGTGSMYRWAKHTYAPYLSYTELNQLAAQAPIGSNGLKVLPFGNGAERMLNNKYTGAQILGIDLNKHTLADTFRAVQEGIAFAFRYGLDIMRKNGMQPSIIRAGKANLFLSPTFAQTLVDVTGIPVALFENDGSVGAAIGAGIGLGAFTVKEAFANVQQSQPIMPLNQEAYEPIYQQWKNILMQTLTPTES